MRKSAFVMMQPIGRPWTKTPNTDIQPPAAGKKTESGR
jgi:hypothetical protein